MDEDEKERIEEDFEDELDYRASNVEMNFEDFLFFGAALVILAIIVGVHFWLGGAS